MATEIRPEDVRNPDVRYERRQANWRGIAASAVALVFIAVLIHFSVVGLFHVFYQDYLKRDVQPNPIQTAEPHRLPPEPRLQPDEVGDMYKLREQEDNVLQSYGWVDKNAGVVRIPVSRALALAAEKGLPQFPAVGPAAAAGAPASAPLPGSAATAVKGLTVAQKK